jgi:hypothetical protein
VIFAIVRFHEKVLFENLQKMKFSELYEYLSKNTSKALVVRMRPPSTRVHNFSAPNLKNDEFCWGWCSGLVRQ